MPVIAISDRGVGIAAGDRERVFERFARLTDDRNGKQGGTGLGLPMARAIATAHGGAVTLRSETSGWTTFELRLGRLEAGDVPSGTDDVRSADERTVTSR